MQLLFLAPTMLYLLVCASGPLESFRYPELDSIATLYAFSIKYLDESKDASRPYLLVDLESEKHARLLGDRAISVKSIWEYWGEGKDYEELHQVIKARPHLYTQYVPKTISWKFLVAAFNLTISLPEQRTVINSFNYLGFLGPIELKGPDLEVGVFEEYTQNNQEQRHVRREDMRIADIHHIMCGRKICDTQRYLMDTFSLKKRAYIGTTSMAAEVSLLMANQALAAPGKICYDPFAGTGSMLLTCAAFGALTFGSDIDGRQLKGKGTASIVTNAEQYGLENRVLDSAVFDMTQHPFRSGEIFDAIITDPPYGVRAGAKRLGRKTPSKSGLAPYLIPGREDEGFAHEMDNYVPPQIGWEMTSVISSLCTFALYLLKPSGRLVFFLPTDNEEYEDVDVPVVEGLRLVSNTLQDYGKWGRRLITMEKVSVEGDSARRKEEEAALDRGIDRLALQMDLVSMRAEPTEKKAGHHDFRERFFSGFEQTKST